MTAGGRLRHAVRAGAVIALLSGGMARGAPVDITDGEGFGELLTALTLDLPTGWQGKGHVAWLKPCSGNDMYEVIFSAAAPDARSGLRMMPGHKVMWTEARVGGVDPYLAQLAVAQNEQSLAAMRSQFRDSNCHVGQVQTSEQILRALVLSKRPQGARIDRIAPNAPVMAQFKAGIGAGTVSGIRTTYDAVIADISYTDPSGPMVERVWLSWYRFADDPAMQVPGMPGMGFETTIIETISLAYAPASRPGDLDVAAGILASTRVNPVWFAKVQAEQAKRQEEQRRIQAERQAVLEAARAQAAAEAAGRDIQRLWRP